MKVGLCSSTCKIRVSGFCSSLRLTLSTKGLALLLNAVVYEDSGPGAQHTEDKRRGKYREAQVDESHNKRITETIVGLVHVRGVNDNGAKAEA